MSDAGALKSEPDKTALPPIPTTNADMPIVPSIPSYMIKSSSTSGDKWYSFSKTSLFLLALPVLLAAFLYSPTRSSTLPKSYALCSPHSSPAVQSIHTIDSTNTLVECIVVHAGKIIQTGSLDNIKEDWYDMYNDGFRARERKDVMSFSTRAKPKRKKGILEFIFLEEGETVLPGLIDSHAHVLQYGESVSTVDLVGATSLTGMSFCYFRLETDFLLKPSPAFNLLFSLSIIILFRGAR